jgi:hypothetical protein
MKSTLRWTAASLVIGAAMQAAGKPSPAVDAGGVWKTMDLGNRQVELRLMPKARYQSREYSIASSKPSADHYQAGTWKLTGNYLILTVELQEDVLVGLPLGVEPEHHVSRLPYARNRLTWTCMDHSVHILTKSLAHPYPYKILLSSPNHPPKS